MAGKFDFLKQARSGPPVLEPPAVAPVAGADERPRGGRPPGKISDPRYRPITVVLRKDTIRRARRKLEDDNSDHDLSELIEQLLTHWMGE